VGRILLGHHGEQEWIFQIMDAVRAAVTNGVQRFTSAQLPSVNESPEGQYRFPARTRDELLQTTREVASSGQVDPRSPFARLKDPAREIGGVQFEVDEDGNVGQAVERQPERKPAPSSGSDWLL